MTHKYKVGDRVRVTGCYGIEGRTGYVTKVDSQGCMVANNLKVKDHYIDGVDFHLYFYKRFIDPCKANTLTLNTNYTAMNGTNWTCIHVRENGNAVLDNGISSAEYTSEGWRVDGDARYDVRWEDEVEEVTWRCSRSGKGLPQYNTLFDVTLNLINGQPDWSSAKVEGV